jgi:hypothetical protein
MNTIITRNNNQYRMSIIYDKTVRSYILVFSSIKDNKGEQYTCASYADAVKRFYDNCRFYGVREVPRVPLTEEEFLGLNPGTLYPSVGGKTCRA